MKAYPGRKVVQFEDTTGRTFSLMVPENDEVNAEWIRKQNIGREKFNRAPIARVVSEKC